MDVRFLVDSGPHPHCPEWDGPTVQLKRTKWSSPGINLAEQTRVYEFQSTTRVHASACFLPIYAQ